MIFGAIPGYNPFECQHRHNLISPPDGSARVYIGAMCPNQALAIVITDLTGKELYRDNTGACVSTVINQLMPDKLDYTLAIPAGTILKTPCTINVSANGERKHSITVTAHAGPIIG